MVYEEMEVMLNRRNKKEAEEVLDFLASLNAKAKKEFLFFLHGAKLAENAGDFCGEK
ncbi:MAG: hypothetical protein K2P14_01935 [Anaeroplasmataceae bacterium]|nr:hypothetical protein [Anaeroplasmataceae bacterium]